MKFAKRVSLLASAFCFSIIFAADVGPSEKAIAVTILKANIPEQTVFIRNLNGTQETISFVSGVSVTSIAEAALNQRLSGGAGYQFLIVCNYKSPQKMITAFHYAGKGEWKTMRGSLTKFNTANRTIVL